MTTSEIKVKSDHPGAFQKIEFSSTIWVGMTTTKYAQQNGFKPVSFSHEIFAKNSTLAQSNQFFATLRHSAKR